ncbi:hypothetical protein ACWCXH_33640 [Kitasatospora sp. NPDC001660]
MIITYEFEEKADRELTEGMAPDGTHAVYAECDGDIIARLLWNPETGVVESVTVEHVWKRQGIATTLWHEATMQAIMRGLAKPRHGEYWTEAGRAWAASL